MNWLEDIYGVKLGSSFRRDKMRIFKYIGKSFFNIADVPVDVTNIGGIYLEPDENGEPIELVSTDATDVNLIQIQALDVNGFFYETAVPLTGTTPVSLGNLSWIYQIRNISPQDHIGIIDVRQVADPLRIYAKINNLPTTRRPQQSFNGLFKVPLNAYRAFVFETLASFSQTAGNKANVVDVDLLFKQKTELTGTYTRYINFIPVQLVADGNSSVDFKPSIPEDLQRGDVLKWQVSFASENNNELTVAYDVMVLFEDGVL